MKIRRISKRFKEHQEVRNLELKYLEKDNVSSAENTLEWAKKNSNTTLVVIDKGRVVGHCSFLPINRGLYLTLLKNSINEKDLRAGDILSSKEKISYLYLSVICVEPEYRKKVVMKLIRKYIEIYDKLVLKKCKIIAICCTKDGLRFAKKYGFKDTKLKDVKVASWKKFKKSL